MFDTLIVFLKKYFEKVNFEKKSADYNKNYPTCKELHLKSENSDPFVFEIRRVECNISKWFTGQSKRQATTVISAITKRECPGSLCRGFVHQSVGEIS